MTDRKVIVALDFADRDMALALVDRIKPDLCRLKVGKELFTSAGPDLVRTLVSKGYDVFLDLKFHDIPTTVAKACMAAADLGVWMINVHTLGGNAMLAAARDALAGDDAPLLIGVTVLTSSNEEELKAIGISQKPEQMVLRLAGMAREQGLDGVVCSAQEAPALKQTCGENFILVTPGIRPEADNTDDQKRVMTPVDAVRNGADYLVIGRPITLAPDPVATLIAINEQLGNQR